MGNHILNATLPSLTQGQWVSSDAKEFNEHTNHGVRISSCIVRGCFRAASGETCRRPAPISAPQLTSRELHARTKACELFPCGRARTQAHACVGRRARERTGAHTSARAHTQPPHQSILVVAKKSIIHSFTHPLARQLIYMHWPTRSLTPKADVAHGLGDAAPMATALTVNMLTVKRGPCGMYVS